MILREEKMTYSQWLSAQFTFRVQKISVDAGFTCPNRDGKVGTGGCTFCNNLSFNPRYCDSKKSIRQQLEEGKRFFARKYPEMKYLAYFQAYSNTYAPLETLRRRYEEALETEDVVGLVIATRPDCADKDTLDYLGKLAKETFLVVEYGVETANDETLRRINRGHTFAQAQRAIRESAERGITTSAHVILGLPGEDREESIRQAPIISRLPITLLKLHQLQIVRGTRLAKQYAEHPFPLYSLEDYLQLVKDYTALLRPDIIIERYISQTPDHLLIAPRWGIKNHEFADMLR